MKMNWRKSLTVAGAAAFGFGVMPSMPANAFTQTWSGAATYRASNDFIPTSKSIYVGGMSCPGKSFYVELVKTSGSSSVWSGPFRLADGKWYAEPGVSVSTSNAYYIRWRSTLGAPTCQGVQAFPTQQKAGSAYSRFHTSAHHQAV